VVKEEGCEVYLLKVEHSDATRFPPRWLRWTDAVSLAPQLVNQTIEPLIRLIGGVGPMQLPVTDKATGTTTFHSVDVAATLLPGGRPVASKLLQKRMSMVLEIEDKLLALLPSTPEIEDCRKRMHSLPTSILTENPAKAKSRKRKDNGPLRGWICTYYASFHLFSHLSYFSFLYCRAADLRHRSVCLPQVCH
jgi:hypothetical protein